MQIYIIDKIYGYLKSDRAVQIVAGTNLEEYDSQRAIVAWTTI
jgi:hypothetical protein